MLFSIQHRVYVGVSNYIYDHKVLHFEIALMQHQLLYYK